MVTPRQTTGRLGEEIAVRTLREAGLSIVERNWRCPVGELDIVAEEIGPDYASGESDARWLRGTARQAVTPRKQAKLREVAGHYLQEKGWRGPWRIDAVAVQLDRSGREVAVEHIRYAVTG
jgi:putative endonuclease